MVNTILLDSGMEKARDIFSWDTTYLCPRDNNPPEYYVHRIISPRDTMLGDMKGWGIPALGIIYIRLRDAMSWDTMSMYRYVRRCIGGDT
jgi:hypothetical protein